MYDGSIVLVDSKLDVIALQMYKESNAPEEYAVGLQEAKDEGAPLSKFFLEMSELLNSNREPLASFSAAAASVVAVRYKYLKQRIY